MQMVPYGQSGHRILALIPAQSDAELMGGAIGRSGRAAGGAASMLAHEIKNPLAGIKGAAQLLARKTDASGERFTSLICAEVDRIATLIDQMEHFSRGQPITCGPINLYQPIHQAMETARARQFPGVRFAEDFDPSLPLVHGNHDAMVQILLNLVTNGCEALGGRDDGLRVRCRGHCERGRDRHEHQGDDGGQGSKALLQRTQTRKGAATWADFKTHGAQA